MLDQTFHPAQAGGANKDLRFRGDANRRVAPAFDFHRKHSAEHGHFLSRDVVPGMRAQPGIMHTLDLSMLGEETGHFHRVLGMSAHPPWQGAHSAQNQPAIERRGNCSAAILDGANALKKFIVDLAHDDAAGDIAMAAKVFGRGMQNEIGAEIERPLQHRRPGIVANQKCAGVVNDPGHGRKIDNLQKWIGGRFRPGQLCF